MPPHSGGGRRRFPNTLSSRRTVLAALLQARARGSRSRELSDIARFIGPHTSVAAVQTVVDANSDVMTRTGTRVVLTAAGLQEVRSHPQPRA